MDEAVKKQAEEEMDCILQLLEEWALKYNEEYVSVAVFVDENKISSFSNKTNHVGIDVYRSKKR